jgi:hypothetical protein
MSSIRELLRAGIEDQVSQTKRVEQDAHGTELFEL